MVPRVHPLLPVPSCAILCPQDVPFPPLRVPIHDPPWDAMATPLPRAGRHRTSPRNSKDPATDLVVSPCFSIGDRPRLWPSMALHSSPDHFKVGFLVISHGFPIDFPFSHWFPMDPQLSAPDGTSWIQAIPGPRFRFGVTCPTLWHNGPRLVRSPRASPTARTKKRELPVGLRDVSSSYRCRDI